MGASEVRQEALYVPNNLDLLILDKNIVTQVFFFSSLLLSSLEMSDTQSLALNTSPSRNRCTFL